MNFKIMRKFKIRRNGISCLRLNDYENKIFCTINNNFEPQS